MCVHVYMYVCVVFVFVSVSVLFVCVCVLCACVCPSSRCRLCGACSRAPRADAAGCQGTAGTFTSLALLCGVIFDSIIVPLINTRVSVVVASPLAAFADGANYLDFHGVENLRVCGHGTVPSPLPTTPRLTPVSLVAH